MAKEPLIHTERLVVIGGSSGSIEALLQILPLLKKGFIFPMIVVLHRNNKSDNGLIELLGSRTVLEVKEADEKDMLLPGNIYIAPPDYHLLVESDKSLSLDATPKVNFSRPSIDVTFTSAAAIVGSNLVAVLLSGANADGALGMAYVEKNGGILIIQDPADAVVGYMPGQALQQTKDALVLPAAEIAAALNALS